MQPSELFAVLDSETGHCEGAYDKEADSKGFADALVIVGSGLYEVVRYTLPQPWTLCRDRQPEKEESCLVCVGKHGENFITVDAYVDGSWITYGDSVYAYRPLPEPAPLPAETEGGK